MKDVLQPFGGEHALAPQVELGDKGALHPGDHGGGKLAETTGEQPEKEIDTPLNAPPVLALGAPLDATPGLALGTAQSKSLGECLLVLAIYVAVLALSLEFKRDDFNRLRQIVKRG